MRRVSIALVFALSLPFVLSACAPEAPPADVPGSSAPTNGETLGPSAAPIALPDCSTIYSPALVSTLEGEGRTLQGDVSSSTGGGWGTFDVGVEVILSAIEESVHCTWVLPESESGSTTSIARLDDASRTALVAALAIADFTVSTAPSGDFYTLVVVDEFISYTEAHLLTDEFWVGSAYAFGDASILTLDAAAELLG